MKTARATVSADFCRTELVPLPDIPPLTGDREELREPSADISSTGADFYVGRLPFLEPIKVANSIITAAQPTPPGAPLGLHCTIENISEIFLVKRISNLVN